MKKFEGLLMCMVALLVQLSVQAQAGLSLGGRITGTDNRKIENGFVRILNTDRSVTCDASGNFLFTDLAAGNYILEVTAAGFATSIEEIQLQKATTDLVIRLAEADRQLDEVIVSAEKKESRLVNLPYSVSALSEKQINQYRLWNTRELTGIVPNFFAGHSGDDRNVISIRGITTTSYDPAVAVYVDGVNQFSLDTYIPQLNDVERIEVLRGPQGTMYGRNAMGGVINIITRQPSNKTKAFVELTNGNFDQYRYTAGLQTPLVKNRFYLGATAMVQGRDGYYKNQFNNKSFDEQQGVSGNYFLKYLLSPKWTITANFKHQNNRNWGAFPLVNGLETALSEPYVLNQNAVGKMVDNTSNASISVQHRSNKILFSSQTAFQRNYRYYRSPLDGDFSPLDAVTIINDYGKKFNKVNVWTQEFRLNNTPSASAVNWTAGAYFFAQEAPVKQATHFGEDAEMIGAPMTNFSSITTSNARNRGLAFFGQVEYAISPKWTVLAGARYDYESRRLNVLGEFQPDGADPIVTRPDTSASAGFSAFSPKLGISYAPTAQGRIFANFTRGFRTGGLTSLGSDPSQPPLFSYKPEYSSNLELGFRQELFDRALRLGVTVFYTELTDAQVPTLVLPDAITVIRNTGKLLSRGIEFEVAAKPFKGLELDYNFGTTRAKYSILKVSSNGEELDLSGKRQLFTPSVTSMLAVQYRRIVFPKAHLGIMVRGEWLYLGEQYFNLSNSIRQSPYQLLNARAGIYSRRSEFFFWSRNITDKQYVSYAYDFGAVHIAPPATYGLTYRYTIQ
ncbi:TonB-dependent receptor [Flavihumibacter sp. CACIAM 22H1]|uniref:TonB-dependent receptor n=1 Tax=Flavihumibacter sp. CACIAM 22H1 TaxID=1812911 RepID=UPI000A474A2F|nr:TonB-dependent receptor [Flavihumibacter sp. CACIAM 22H1]